jgi:hypothetical protein
VDSNDAPSGEGDSPDAPSDVVERELDGPDIVERAALRMTRWGDAISGARSAWVPALACSRSTRVITMLLLAQALGLVPSRLIEHLLKVL